jgi:CheY-like chemotaxis protein
MAKANTTHSSGEGKTILVLEDEPDVRRLVSTVLTNYGYKVLMADNGDNAIKAYKKSRQPVDLLLLDVVSPGLAGPMVADRITEMQPGVPVVFMSGYGHTSIVQKYVVEKGYLLVTKPFTEDQLTRKVSEAIQSAAR